MVQKYSIVIITGQSKIYKFKSSLTVYEKVREMIYECRPSGVRSYGVGSDATDLARAAATGLYVMNGAAM